MKVIIIALVLISFTEVSAQKHMRNPEKLDSAKIVFISQKLLLSSSQSEKFWPAYKEYSEKRTDLRKSIKKMREEQANVNATDEQLKSTLKTILKIRKEELDLDYEFQNQLMGILSVRQVVALQNAEREFMMLLRKRLRSEKTGPGY